MRSDFIQDILDNISIEEMEAFSRETEAFLEREKWLSDNGYVYNTPTSYSLELLNKAGHYPIGITSIGCEESFIFTTRKKANKAWRSRVLGYEGYFYSLMDFRKEKKWYESNVKSKLKVHWLWKKE